MHLASQTLINVYINCWDVFGLGQMVIVQYFFIKQKEDWYVLLVKKIFSDL